LGGCTREQIARTFASIEIEGKKMSLKEIKNRNIYLSVQDWPQAPVTTSDDEPQIDGENSSDPQEDFFVMSLAALEHDPVLSRQVNVFRKVYFRSERIADKTSLEYRYAKQLSALLAKQILQELTIDTKRVTPN
jgi:hypothetical protein